MPEHTITYLRAAAVWWYSARQLRLQAGGGERQEGVLAVHTACDCSCKGSESGKAEAVTAFVGLSLGNGGDDPSLKLSRGLA